ncbi:MAG TPA: hypothetical protein H9667_05485 [Firmicutes bacterium]|nr:hypothetical protein [Bacillota bacterium]
MEILLFVFIAMQVLLIFWLFVLSLKVNRLKEDLTENTRIKREMEQLFESYLMEVRVENENLLKQLQQIPTHSLKRSNLTSSVKKVSSQTNMSKESNVNQMMPQIKSDALIYEKPVASQSKNIKSKNSLTSSDESVKLSTKNISEEIHKKKEQTRKKIPALTVGQNPIDKNVEKEEIYVQSLTAQALLLQEQGMELDEIAKKLNKGRTELELLLKFRQ